VRHGNETAAERVTEEDEARARAIIARYADKRAVEYLSLARCNGRWAMVNILWRFQAPRDRPQQNDR
jgi:hypothetical protein